MLIIFSHQSDEAMITPNKNKTFDNNKRTTALIRTYHGSFKKAFIKVKSALVHLESLIRLSILSGVKR